MFKYLAALFMLIDHIAYILEPLLPEPAVMVMRGIGRLAFPMFAYALARGYNRTRNIFHYFLRMSFFAVITQILFTVFTQYFDLRQLLIQNVLITFSLCLAVLAGIDLITKSSLDMIVTLRPVLSDGEVNKHFSPGGIRLPAWLGTVIGLFLIVGALFLMIRIEPDYSFFGLLTVLVFQKLDRSEPKYEKTMRRDLKLKRWGLYLLLYGVINLVFAYGNIRTHGLQYYAWIELLSVPAVLLFPLYEWQRKPGTFGKYFFYLFYPLHFCLLLVLRYFLVQ